ncbi:MAG: CHAT domain-containing protein [Oculatellaceae cyanobacterium bins.114]|nr:CHAT domain-containing protein [Oculatellaceae cyanobacterium bins.114]
MHPPISIIIPVYNRESYLATTIASVLRQSRDDFEVLIWDDGSTDRSLDIANYYAKRDHRVRVISAPNQGLAAVCQQAIALTQGDYFGVVDSDDGLAPTALATTAAVLDANADVGMVYTDYVEIDAAGKLKGYGQRCRTPYHRDRLLLEFMTFHFRLIRRSTFEQTKGINLEAGQIYDYDLCLQLSEVGEIHHVPKPLYYYRVHDNRLSCDRHLEQIFLSRQVILQAMERRGLSDRFELEFQLDLIDSDFRGRFALRPKKILSIAKPLNSATPFAASTPVKESKGERCWLASHPQLLRRTGAFLATLPLAGAIGTGLAMAQSVVPANDGTQTTVTRQSVYPQGGTASHRYNITGGQLSSNGANLFHSLERFGLSAQEIANFQSNPAIQNILTRVVGGDPSIINGLLQVTGGNSNLYLLNPAGILFGANARLDVPGAFTATTATGIGFDQGWLSAVGTNDYAALVGEPNQFAFATAQPGAIVNAGVLNVPTGESVTLLGGTVVNTGTISAPGGQITIAAVPGENLIRISQAGSLLSLDVQPAQGNLPNPLSSTPVSLPELLTGGSIEGATGLTVEPDGTVRLTSSGVEIPSGTGVAIVSGTLNAANTDAQAANSQTVRVLGDRVGLLEANINVTGTSGGGTVLIGGDYQGQGTVPSSDRTVVSRSSTINADALETGNGGRVIVWADDSTAFLGSISAQGGSQSGNGGFVEVSGRQNLLFDGNVDLTALNGTTGSLLLDPLNITIVATAPGSDDAAIADGIVNATDDPTLNYTISATALQAIAGDITLEASNDIIISPGLSLTLTGTPTSTITFRADADNNNTGEFRMDTASNITAPNRNLVISGFNIIAGNLQTVSGGFSPPGIPARNVTLNARNNINVGNIDTRFTGTFGTGYDGGAVSITSTQGNVTATSIDTRSSAGSGGAVDLSGDLLLVSGTIPSLPGTSIATTGSTGTGTVTMNHAGGSTNAPFRIGSAFTSGTTGAINTSSGLSFPVLAAGGAAPGTPAGITINSVNAAPVLPGSAPLLTTPENQALTFSYPTLGLIATDANGDVIEYRIVSIEAGATLSQGGTPLTVGSVFSASGNLTYTPPANSTGTRTAFSVRATDQVDGDGELSSSGTASVQVDITPTPTPTPTPIPTPTPTPTPTPVPTPVPTPPPTVLPDSGFDDPRIDIPGTTLLTPTTEVPPVSIDTTISTLERNYTRQYGSYLGLDQTPIATLDEAQAIAREIEEATGIKPAFVYINFVPESVDGLVGVPIQPTDTDQLEVVVVTKDTVIRRRIAEATRARVMTTAQQFRGEITNPRRVDTTSYMPTAQQLYRWFIEPIASDLQTQEINNLVFLPDAGLRSLPYAALHNGQQFLVEQYSIGLMPSLSLTDMRYVDIRNSTVLAMGISESTQGQVPLPGVPVELTTIALDLWRGSIYLNDRATLDNLKRTRQQTPYGIIHMATHADIVAGAANESYIQLWNDKLRMDQLRELGWNDPPVNLLVLSACRTALGSEEAELGFAGLAVQAGVKSVLASLWYVSDAGTAALMTGFYQSLNTAPIKAEALREAQVAMATGQVYIHNGTIQGLSKPIALPGVSLDTGDRSLSHPYYWAAFTMVGNPW